jgi:septal ring factor EnvC (AmiA/AmiB activator)
MKFLPCPLSWGKKQRLFLLIWAILISFSPLASLNITAVEQTIDYHKKLEKLRLEIANLKKKIQKEEKRKNSILSELSQITLQKRMLQKELSLYRTKIKQTDQEISQIKARIPILKKELQSQNQALANILQVIYKHGQPGILDFFLRANNLNQILSEEHHLSLLADYQQKAIQQYLESLHKLEEAEGNLEKKKAELQLLFQQSKAKENELRQQERQKKALIKKIEGNRKSYLQTLQELNEQAQQLRKLIKRLKKEEFKLPFRIIPLYEKRGRLPWPCQGEVLTKFGIQRHPRFNTMIMNNGIEISAEKDTPVKAIHDGFVVYCDYFRGYGNLIIIDHGLAYYSLYGHCSDFLVEKGDIVRTGQPIALVGDSDSLVGPALYFELRFKTKPLNPLKWLKRR